MGQDTLAAVSLSIHAAQAGGAGLRAEPAVRSPAFD
jgi:hypothetical protein